MGEILPIREGVEAAPADLTDAIALAYRSASLKFSSRVCAVPRQHACIILINGIIDGAARGIRDVEQLCEEALALLNNHQLRKGNEHQP
jgi:hypothetical protein